jgi:putative ABC transport system permease protein
MLRFVSQKLLHKKWIILCLLIGNVLLISIACMNPMYMKASLQKMLTSSLNNYLEEKNEYPLIVNYTVKTDPNYITGGAFFRDLDTLSSRTEKKFQLSFLLKIEGGFTRTTRIILENQRQSKLAEKMMKVAYLSELEQHIKIINGEMYAKEPDEQGIIDCILSHKALVASGMVIGDVFELPQFITKDNEPMRLRITGTFEAAEEKDAYWIKTPQRYRTECFIDEELFRQYLYTDGKPICSIDRSFSYLFDYTSVNPEQVQILMSSAKNISEEAKNNSTVTVEYNYQNTIEQYLKKAKQVTIIMWIMLIPMFVLLAAFNFMVSRQVLDIEQNEIAVLKSRGVSKRQIIMVYLLQSAILAGVGLMIGIPVGFGLCKVLGASNAFMEFINRKALQVELDGKAILYAVVAAVFSVAVMTIPVFKHSNVSIVEQKQKKSMNTQPLWQKVYLDVLLLGVSIYGFYNFYSQKDLLAQRIAEGEALDPFLFLDSSLFIFSAGLISLRILPLIARIIYLLGKKLWSPALYASFLHVLRTKRKQGFISVFLVLTIAMGIFNANTARTINRNEEDRVRYDVGAELVIQEVWPNNAAMLNQFPDMELTYYEPDFWKYKNLKNIEGMTRVIRDKNITVSYSGTIKGVELMAINTKEFGKTAWFRDGVLDTHWYHYLNCISQNPRAILVSKNMQENLGLKLGDKLLYKNSQDKSTIGLVSGFVSAWPTYSDKTTEISKDKTKNVIDHYLIIANFDQVQNHFGITPYEIWMNIDGSSDFLYDFAEENKIEFAKFEDTSAKIIKMKNDPIFQVTNGVLTIDFIFILILCTVGFLIYWISSIRSRELLFGVYRAMGMSMREIWSMLINEHIFISILSMGMGIVIGTIASYLFIPLIELTYAPSMHTLPTIFEASGKDMLQLAVVIICMLVFCITVLGILISRIKISQALKLGED